MKYLLERKISIIITNLKMADQKQRNHLTLEVKNFIVQQKLQRSKKSQRNLKNDVSVKYGIQTSKGTI